MFAQAVGSETISPSGSLVYTVRVEEKLLPGVHSATGLVTAPEGTPSASIVLRVEPR